MVLTMALLRAYYMLTVIIVGIMSYFLWSVPVAVGLYLLLIIVVRAIPVQLAWHRSNFSRLILMCITTIIYSIFVYGFLYFQSGLVSDGELRSVSLEEAIYFSATTWTTLGYGDLTASPELYILTSLEAVNGYFGMAVMVALMVLWINEGLNALDQRMERLRTLPPEDKQKIDDKVDEIINRIDTGKSVSKDKTPNG